jgi:hypothetical protein
MRGMLRRPGQRGATRSAAYIVLNLGESLIDVGLIDAPASAVDDRLAIQVDLWSRDASACA